MLCKKIPGNAKSIQGVFKYTAKYFESGKENVPLNDILLGKLARGKFSHSLMSIEHHNFVKWQT